ncbi:SGNH hydrolase domain-containing protein [Planktotalea frisia]|nr:SGNH hydrolase domain-containing protein [Planktotalea frisia]
MMRWFITLGAAILALTLGGFIVVQEGAPWRVLSERIYPTAKEMRAQESALCQGTDVRDGVTLGGKANQPIITCSHDIGAQESLYVWGDSHGRHLLAGLIDSFPEHNIHILYFTSCLAQSGSAGYVYTYEGRDAFERDCLDRNARARAFFEQLKPSAVLLHQYFEYEGQFSDAWFAATDEIIAGLEASGHRVAFIGGVIMPGVALGSCLAVPALISDVQLSRRCLGIPEPADRILARNDNLAQRFADHFVNVNDFFCPKSGPCLTTDGSTLLFRDKHHLTLEGSRMMIQAIRPRLSQLLRL